VCVQKVHLKHKIYNLQRHKPHILIVVVERQKSMERRTELKYTITQFAVPLVHENNYIYLI